MMVVLLALMLQQQPVQRDTSFRAGWYAGEHAAAQVHGGGYGTFAAISGLPFGFFGPLVISGESGPGFKIITALSVSGIIATVRAARHSGRTLPANVEREIESQPQRFQDGFRAGYREKLSSRFQGQAVGGAIMGTLAGFGLLYYAATHID